MKGSTVTQARHSAARGLAALRTTLLCIAWSAVPTLPLVAADGPDCEAVSPHLSDQAQDPFLFHGKPVDPSHPQWRRYRPVLNDFPSVRDCLLPEEAVEASPDLGLVDWKRVGTGTAAEVCVFRVARSLDDPGAIFDWLSAQGFRFKRQLIPYKGVDYVPRFPGEPVYNVTATWTVAQYREKNPSLLARIFGIEPVIGYSLVLQFSQSCEVVGVGAGSSSK